MDDSSLSCGDKGSNGIQFIRRFLSIIRSKKVQEPVSPVKDLFVVSRYTDTAILLDPSSTPVCIASEAAKMNQAMLKKVTFVPKSSRFISILLVTCSCITSAVSIIHSSGLDKSALISLY